MKLSTKASFLLTGLVLLVIAATSVFLFASQRNAILGLVKQDMESIAESVAMEVRAFFRDNLQNMAAVAGNLHPEVLGKGDPDAVEHYLKLQMEFFPKFENGLFVLDAQGRFLADYPPHPELRGQSFAHREYYLSTKAQGHGVVGLPYLSARTGLPVVTFTWPVLSVQGRLEYVVCGSLNLLSPQALGDYSRRRIGKSGYIYLVDKDRTVVVHPDKTRILRAQEPGRNLFVDKAAGGFEGSGRTVNSQGVPMIVGSRQVQDIGWAVLAQVPESEALAPMREEVFALGLFFLAMLCLVLPIGHMAMRRITLPLDRLEKAVQVVTRDLRESEGRGSRPFAAQALDTLRALRSSDEIGQLAKAFFQLSLRLKKTLGSLKVSAEDWERTFSSVQEALLVLDKEGRALRLNGVAQGLFRLKKGAGVSRHWREILAGAYTALADWPTDEVLRETERYKITTALPGRPGRFELAFSAIKGRGGASGMLLAVTEVTQKHLAEERIRELAFQDALTGLPNRVLLKDRVEQALATSERNGTRTGILFLDLDDFKQVNDTFGHDAGDELLVQAGRRLNACLRANDTLARFAGDEFVAVLVDIKNPREASAVAERMLACLRERFLLSRGDVSVGASIGIALYPDHGVTAQMLLSHADTAMYRAKGRGKNGFSFSSIPEPIDMESLPTQ